MKTKKYLFMLATLFSAAIGFTACSSEDDLASSEQEERGVVKTEFTISFPQKVSAITRMSPEIVQVPNASNQVTFRGIRNIQLTPFNVQKSAIDGETEFKAPINLIAGTTVAGIGASGTTANSIDKGALLTTSNSHLYQDVDIPIGTKAFMFYGEAAVDPAVIIEDPAIYGYLEKHTGTQLKNNYFSLLQINSTKDIGENGAAIAEYMTNIAYAETDGTPKLTWRESENVGLQYLYSNFISIYNGSWTNIKAAVQRLYISMQDGDADTDNTKAIKKAVRDAITGDITTRKADKTVDKTYTVIASGTTLTFPEMGNYPADKNLPDGAAYVYWQDVVQSDNTTRKEFVALSDAGETGLNMASLDSYTYPSSLYYYGLSNIKTSKSSEKDAYTNENSWSTILAAYTDAEATKDASNVVAVTKDTRSIAIEEEVQYAVGRLDITVNAWDKTNKTGKNTLKDNANNSFDVASTSTIFPVTGILLSNQKEVDYKFQPRSSTPRIIYDKEVGTGIYLNQTESNVIHTLALETETTNASVESDETGLVKIVVEFVNNSGQDIVGYNNGIIYPGCKFYLVGTLDPRKTSDLNTSSASGITQTIKQDYTTTARLKIDNLTNAYNILPDLTLPKLEMGLSVNLAWTPGIDINIIID